MKIVKIKNMIPFFTGISLLIESLVSCTTPSSHIDRCINSVNSCQGVFLSDQRDLAPSVRGFQKVKDMDDWKNSVELWSIPEGATKSIYLGRFAVEPVRDRRDTIVPGEVQIVYVEVESKFRERGAQDAMFTMYLSKNPTVKKIYSGFSETNAEAF